MGPKQREANLAHTFGSMVASPIMGYKEPRFVFDEL